MASGFGCSHQLWWPVHRETTFLLNCQCPHSSLWHILLQSHNGLTRSSRIPAVQTMNMWVFFPWLLAHRRSAEDLLSLPLGSTWLLPSPSWHCPGNVPAWPYQWLKYWNKAMLSGHEPLPAPPAPLLWMPPACRPVAQPFACSLGGAEGLQGFPQQPSSLRLTAIGHELLTLQNMLSSSSHQLPCFTGNCFGAPPHPKSFFQNAAK